MNICKQNRFFFLLLTHRTWSICVSRDLHVNEKLNVLLELGMFAPSWNRNNVYAPPGKHSAGAHECSWRVIFACHFLQIKAIFIEAWCESRLRRKKKSRYFPAWDKFLYISRKKNPIFRKEQNEKFETKQCKKNKKKEPKKLNKLNQTL